MSKKLYLFLGILLLVIVASGILLRQGKSVAPIACTMEAKLCPDGSAVGRSGPNCEFAPCPEAPGIIHGQVTVGPICPVERVGVPCPVPVEAYTSREVILYSADGSTEIKRMNFTPEGTYQFFVPAGDYLLDTPKQGIGGASGLPKAVTVKAGETIQVDFSIDTGIR